MTWDGMLPKTSCKSCGKDLGTHPAELYAGTFTGDCYECEKKGPSVIKTYPDGAELISYPPHAPSWRRDRELEIAYPDCEDCDGKGRHYVSWSFAHGGGYYRNCTTCTTRYYNHPFRLWDSARVNLILRAGNAVYEKECRRRRVWTKAKKNLLPQELYKEIANPVLERYRAVLNLHRVRCESKGF